MNGPAFGGVYITTIEIAQEKTNLVYRSQSQSKKTRPHCLAPDEIIKIRSHLVGATCGEYVLCFDFKTVSSTSLCGDMSFISLIKSQTHAFTWILTQKLFCQLQFASIIRVTANHLYLDQHYRIFNLFLHIQAKLEKFKNNHFLGANLQKKRH